MSGDILSCSCHRRGQGLTWSSCCIPTVGCLLIIICMCYRLNYITSTAVHSVLPGTRYRCHVYNASGRIYPRFGKNLQGPASAQSQEPVWRKVGANAPTSVLPTLAPMFETGRNGWSGVLLLYDTAWEPVESAKVCTVRLENRSSLPKFVHQTKHHGRQTYLQIVQVKRNPSFLRRAFTAPVFCLCLSRVRAHASATLKIYQVHNSLPRSASML